MTRKKEGTGFTRRDFVKTVGLAGLAVAGGGATGAIAAPKPPAAAVKTDTVPKRKLGKTGVDVSILNLGCMFDTINNQLLLKQAVKWAAALRGAPGNRIRQGVVDLEHTRAFSKL